MTKLCWPPCLSSNALLKYIWKRNNYPNTKWSFKSDRESSNSSSSLFPTCFASNKPNSKILNKTSKNHSSGISMYSTSKFNHSNQFLKLKSIIAKLSIRAVPGRGTTNLCLFSAKFSSRLILFSCYIHSEMMTEKRSKSKT